MYLKNVLLILFVTSFFIGYVQGQIYRDSLEVSVDKKPKKDTIEAFIKRSKDLTNSNPPQAIEYAILSYDLATQIKSTQLVYESALQLSLLHDILTDHKKAFDYAKIALENATILDDDAKIADATYQLGTIYFSVFELEKSVELYYESLTYYDKINDRKGYLIALNGIGNIYTAQENYDKALDIFFDCYNISLEINDERNRAAILNNIAHSYMGKGYYEKSIPYLEESIGIYELHNNKYWQSVGNFNLGDCYSNIPKNKENAITYLEKAIDLATEINNYDTIILSKLSLASYHKNNTNINVSIALAQEAYQLGKAYNLPHYVKRAAAILQNCYALLDKHKDAYKYLAVEYELSNSLGIEKSIEKIAKLEFQNKIEKEQYLLKIAHQKQKFKQYMVGGLLVMILLGIILYLIIKFRKKIKKIFFETKEINNQLNLKNKELALNAIQLVKSSDSLNVISQELTTLKNTTSDNGIKKSLNRLNKRVQKIYDIKSWNEFEIRFKEVHEDFYQKLSSRYPELSPGDIRLCSFLKLNLSTKEISEITGQSISAIEKARYRLRKKLKINNKTVNLTTFMINL